MLIFYVQNITNFILLNNSYIKYAFIFTWYFSMIPFLLLFVNNILENIFIFSKYFIILLDVLLLGIILDLITLLILCLYK